MSTFRLTFITPLFSRGAYEDRPEIRPTSIRGQLHWWFRALGGKLAEEKAIFGGVHRGATASRIVIRVSAVEGTVTNADTLPHKGAGRASSKAAFAPKTRFDLHVLERPRPLEGRLKSAFERALECWLLLGALGLRSTRAAGSFHWEPIHRTEEPPRPPVDFAAYEARCSALLNGAPIRFALLDRTYPAAEQARKVVSDTLGGRDDPTGERDLARMNHPLGKIWPGDRKTSPLRFRIVHVANQYRIAVTWDARVAVTGNKPEDLKGIIRLLLERKPALGAQLAASALANNK
jgi:CRISPR type III-B/RAMP module RAMP protein Cmr1